MMLPSIPLAIAGVLMPPPVARTAAGILFVLAGSVLAAHAVLIALAAQRSALAPRTRMRAPLLAGVFLAAWLAVAIVTADGANFAPVPGASRLGVTLAIMLIPFTAAVVLLFTSKTLRAINAAMPPAWLVRVQSYRLAGFIFLVYMFAGVVPGGFAWPAAVGDMITGLLALIVGHAVANERPRALGWAVAWNLFGMLDLIVVPLAALHSSARVITLYPLAIVPLFLGPPLGMLTHIYSLRNLAVARRAAEVIRGHAARSAPRVAPSAGDPLTTPL